MKFIAILIALLLVGLLVAKQLNQGGEHAVAPVPVGSGPVVPTVPNTPQGLPQFEKDMNNFVKDSAAERNKELEKMDGSKSQ